LQSENDNYIVKLYSHWQWFEAKQPKVILSSRYDLTCLCVSLIIQ